MDLSTIVPARVRTRLDGIDALRGLAIFFVLMNHVNIRLRLAQVPYTAGLPRQLVSALVWNGQYGVQIFFAISGFLITSMALQRWGSLGRIDLREFYVLRFARIAPLLALLLVLLSLLHGFQLKYFVVPAKTGGLGRAILAALTFHVNVLEARRGYLPGNWDILWSLSIEEMFYLFFPLVCRVLGQGRKLIAVLLFFLVMGPIGRTALANGNEIWKEYSYWGGMDAIALGCITALLVQRVRFSLPGLRVFAGAGLAAMGFILCFSIPVNRLGLERAGLDMTVLATGACMVIVASAQAQCKRPRLLVPLIGLGRRSYEVYLTHMFVVFAFFQMFLNAGKPMSAVPWFFIAVILVAGFLGEAVARTFSDPMNRRLRLKLKEEDPAEAHLILPLKPFSQSDHW